MFEFLSYFVCSLKCSVVLPNTLKYPKFMNVELAPIAFRKFAQLHAYRSGGEQLPSVVILLSIRDGTVQQNANLFHRKLQLLLLLLLFFSDPLEPIQSNILVGTQSEDGANDENGGIAQNRLYAIINKHELYLFGLRSIYLVTLIITINNADNYHTTKLTVG